MRFYWYGVLAFGLLVIFAVCWVVVGRYRRSRANDINSFLNSEFRKLYYYEFGRQSCSRWQIGVLENDDDSWDFCNYFEDVYKNLIDEYKRLTNNEDRL